MNEFPRAHRSVGGRDRGATSIEYALLVALIAIAAVGSLTIFGPAIVRALAGDSEVAAGDETSSIVEEGSGADPDAAPADEAGDDGDLPRSTFDDLAGRFRDYVDEHRAFPTSIDELGLDGASNEGVVYTVSGEWITMSPAGGYSVSFVGADGKVATLNRNQAIVGVPLTGTWHVVNTTGRQSPDDANRIDTSTVVVARG